MGRRDNTMTSKTHAEIEIAVMACSPTKTRGPCQAFAQRRMKTGRIHLIPKLRSRPFISHLYRLAHPQQSSKHFLFPPHWSLSMSEYSLISNTTPMSTEDPLPLS